MKICSKILKNLLKTLYEKINVQANNLFITKDKIIINGKNYEDISEIETAVKSNKK